MNTSYDYWRNALQGNFGSVHDGDPHPGFYRFRVKGGPDEPVAIWPLDGEMVAYRNGRKVDAAEIWSWVCRNPIDEAIYRSVYEKGEPWPDAIEELIGRGSNNPPTDETAADEVKAAVDAAMAELAKPLTDQAGCDRLANHRDRLAKMYKAKEGERKEAKQPHMDAAAAVDARFKPVLAIIEEAGAKLKTAITAWLLKEEQRRREEAIAEARRQEEAAKAAAAANLPPPEPQPLPEVERPKAGTAGRATALRTYKSAVITDYAAALAHFANHDEVKAVVQALADRAARADIAAPGCEIKTDRRAA